jgi:hypothetical protein
LAFTTIVGGFLNLLGLISPILGRTYLAVGFAVLAWLTFCRRKAILSILRKRLAGTLRGPLLVVAVVFFVLAVTYLMSAGIHASFNGHDDSHAYLVFPNKMLQTGSQGQDPFSERRMYEYGGQSFLHALMLTTVNLRGLHSLDFGVGWLLAMALVIGHARRGGVAPGACLAVLLALPLFAAPPIVNVTSLVTGLVLFYALMRTFLESREESLATRVVVMAMLLAGIVTLKNNFIPPAGLILLLLYVFAAGPMSLRRKIGEPVLVAGVALIFLAPWMVSMYGSNGTFLYPILGNGYYASPASGFISATCGSFDIPVVLARLREPRFHLLFLVGIVLVLLPFARRDRATSRRLANLLIFFAVWAGAFFVGLASDWGIGTRYDYPFTMAVTIFLIMESLGTFSGARDSSVKPRLAVFCYAAVVVVAVLSLSVSSLLRGPFFPVEQFQWKSFFPQAAGKSFQPGGVQAVQGAIPPHARVLARLSEPYLLNFRRNPIYIIDWPGGSSPPPGMPLDSAEAIAEYLRNQGIRYVMYSYKNEADYPQNGLSHRLWTETRKGYRGRIRVLTLFTFMFQDRLLELGNLYRKLADDGETFALDLMHPRAK